LQARIFIIFAMILAGFFQLGTAFGLNFDGMRQQLISRFGPGPGVLFADWQNLLVSHQSSSESEKLKLINNFFNQRIAFDDDISIWGQSDYWATPLETLGRGRGDCEDFSIAKYYSLLHLGISESKLRLVYVKARQNLSQGPVIQAHMVLAYYPSPSAMPLVLDNLDPTIKPANQRGDLTPVFSFNSQGLWQGTGNKATSSKFSRWQELQQRARSEGQR